MDDVEDDPDRDPDPLCRTLDAYLFEIACMVQVRAQAGGELVPIPQTVLDRAPAQMAQLPLGSGGVLAWPALLRRLDRKSPGYAT
ncbi:MAG: hypothetical protein NT062_08985 [Proteobacteria bacterium]|nr:hypothetical protein [Pseudomonadota bacterium]